MNANDTPTPSNPPKLGLQVVLAVGASSQSILHPVRDEAEAIALMRAIKKTPGFFMIGEDTLAPVMFHVRHVVITQIVFMPEAAPQAPKLARVQ